MQNLKFLSGIFIFISFLLTIYSYFLDNSLFIWSGVFAWTSLLILFKGASNIKLLIILLVLSFIAFLFSSIKGYEIDFQKAILVNQYLLSLLIGVGFLRLIATPKEEKIKELPKGKKAFLKTYLGIHLFGSVINLSSLILVADKLYKKAPLTKLQVLTLSRAFSSDAYWSPFFVAFAAAHTYAPNFNSSTVLSLGLFLAITSFFITYFEVLKKYDLKEFRGYPIHFETLYIPVVLAFMVLVVNHYSPEFKVILLIASFSLFLTIIILPAKIGLLEAFKKLNSHIEKELPKMKNELTLFLVAGMFGVSISSVLVGLNITLPFEQFNGFWASILLLIFILLSFIGIHPIISIAVIGSWTDELNHTLLVVTFLMAWANTVATSPFSGLALTIQARYKLKAKDIFLLNLPHTLKMYIIYVIILFLLSNYLGL